MSLPYLIIEPEEAIKIIDDCIVKGYKVKDVIKNEYYTNKSEVNERITNWRAISNNWTKETIDHLARIFVSQKELYNFRDAEPPFSATSENTQFIGIVSYIKARLDKLNEYDKYIRQQFNVSIEVVGRDKIIQTGSNSTIDINN